MTVLTITTDLLEDHRFARSLRALAASGELWCAELMAPAEIPRLRGEAFETVLPLVWERHTRPLELRKRHRGCATAISSLEPECLDGFTDDLESVIAALMAYRRPIASLEGWITMRMANAIKDGYRVRRAREMGAQQRVRVPSGLAARLADDPWLVALAERMLQWTGVRQTAGVGLWPVDRWLEDRAIIAGSAIGASSATVATEVAAVLTAMKDWDAAWYEKYVEIPLGRKWTPVAAGYLHGADGRTDEDLVLELVQPGDRADARLADAASACLETIRAGLAEDRDPAAVVKDAITASYLSPDDWAAWELDRVPGDNDDIGLMIESMVANPKALERLVLEVLDILTDEHAVPPRTAC